MMSRQTFGAVVVLMLAGFGGWYFFGIDASPEESEAENSAMVAETIADEMNERSAFVIRYTDEGYAPSSLAIEHGQSVTFMNDSSRETWPAFAMHPTHTAYPGSGIEKCDTDNDPGIFDACHGLKPGESWSFTFDEVGTWKYHDHLNGGNFGSITVE